MTDNGDGTFKASNGIEITSDRGNIRLWYGGGRSEENNLLSYRNYLHEDEISAIAEMVQHQRDTELGRWRSKKFPYVTAFHSADESIYRFVNEETGNTIDVDLDSDERHSGWCSGPLAELLEQIKRKPWREAIAFDVWQLAFDDRGMIPDVFQVMYGDEREPRFYSVRKDCEGYRLDDPRIVDAKLILRPLGNTED